jgi:hypothetical protein
MSLSNSVSSLQFSFWHGCFSGLLLVHLPAFSSFGVPFSVITKKVYVLVLSQHGEVLLGGVFSMAMADNCFACKWLVIGCFWLSQMCLMWWGCFVLQDYWYLRSPSGFNVLSENSVFIFFSSQ